VRDRVVEIGADFRRIRTRAGAGVGVPGIDQPERAMRFDVVLVDRQAGLRRPLCLVGLTAPQEERRHLPTQLGRLGRRLHGAIERRLRSREVAGAFEPPGHQEFEVRVGFGLRERTRRGAASEPTTTTDATQAVKSHQVDFSPDAIVAVAWRFDGTRS
jgi:hypothetical protein